MVPVSHHMPQSMLMPDDVSDLYAQALDDARSSCGASAAIYTARHEGSFPGTLEDSNL